jgi:hypothetical protein
MTLPAQMDEDLVAELHEHFTDDQLVELTLKVMKFNIQKVMVSLGTDFPVTTEKLSSWDPEGSFVLVDQGRS